MKPAEVAAISPQGKKVIGAGVALIALGFVVLSYADPLGRNWASSTTPFLILGGYALVAMGIFWPVAAPKEVKRLATSGKP